MNEQLRDQISAFLDSELPGAEGELLVRRLGREDGLYGVARRYLLIGQALRGETVGGAADSFHRRVMLAIDDLDGVAEPDEAPPESVGDLRGHRSSRGRWRRSLTGVGAAAAVALGAVVVLQMTQHDGGQSPSQQQAATTVAPIADADAVPDLRSGMPPIRLTNYLMSHGEYASSVGRMGVQSGIVGTSAARAMGGYFERETQERDEQ